MTKYVFIDEKYNELDGEGLANDSMAECGSVMMQDTGNGVKIWIEGRRKKPLELDYSEWCNLLRCAKMMERECRLVDAVPLDISTMCVLLREDD